MAEETTKQETSRAAQNDTPMDSNKELAKDNKKDATVDSQKPTQDPQKADQGDEKRPRKSSLKKGSQLNPAKESRIQETFHDAEEQDTGSEDPEKDVTADALTSNPVSGNEQAEAAKKKQDELFPGDDIIPDAVMVYDQKRTIRATAKEIFPWLRQMGKGRGGWYLPLRMEALLPKKWRAVRQIEPSWQKLSQGERLADYGFSRNDYFVVERVEEPHTIVLRSRRYGNECTWALLLRELHDHPADPEPATVVHLRFRGKLKAEGVKRKVIVQSARVLQKVNTLPMLMGLAERTERPKNSNADKLHSE